MSYCTRTVVKSVRLVGMRGWSLKNCSSDERGVKTCSCTALSNQCTLFQLFDIMSLIGVHS